MNHLAQEELRKQADPAEYEKLKAFVELEFRESFRRCGSCQRWGEWKKKCGRCKAQYYCTRDCQKWAWAVHKNHCVPFGEAPPPRPPKPPKVEAPRPPPADDVDLTDARLRIDYLEACGDVDAACARARARLAVGTLTRVLVTGGGGRRCLMEAPDGGALDADEVVRGHARAALLELREANPRCSLAHDRGKGPAAPPLTKTPPRFPPLLLDDAIPTAFVGFAGLNEAFVKAAAQDPDFLPSLATSRLAGYERGDAPTPCEGMPDAVLIFFVGLHEARPELAKVHAHVLGSCRNNFVAAAVARKALFYALEAEEHYRSPVDANEAFVNTRGAGVDVASMFATTCLDELAALDEREVEARFPVPLGGPT